MAKLEWKPGTLLYPVPVVLVSCGNIDGVKNMITIAWAGTVASDDRVGGFAAGRLFGILSP